MDPNNPNLIVAGWNDYCSDWMGLGFSTDGGQTWTNSLVPGYPADTSTEGMQSPEYIRTNNASDPLGAFDTHGHFYFGAISYNGFAGPKTNADVWVAEVRLSTRHRTTATRSTTWAPPGSGKGTPSRELPRQVPRQADARGRPHRRPTDGNVYMCFTKFPGQRARHDLLLRLEGRRAHVLQADRDQRSMLARRAATSRSSTTATSRVVAHDRTRAPRRRTSAWPRSAPRNAGATFSKPVMVAELPEYNPFDGPATAATEWTRAHPGSSSRACRSSRGLTADPTGDCRASIRSCRPPTRRRSWRAPRRTRRSGRRARAVSWAAA